MKAYIFTGKIIPERALLDITEVQFGILASEDVPPGELFVEIIKSQIIARFLAPAEVKNIFSLRNAVEDAVRMLLDAAGYFHGYGYDVEIVSLILPESSQKYVFGIDVPVLAGLCEKVGLTYNDIMAAVAKSDGGHLRHALADVREAIKSPRDTGFFCYRAIESLKNCCAFRNHMLPEDSASWERFRETYSITKEQIMKIKMFADQARHGNHSLAQPMGDKQRADIFKTTWNIINVYILGERKGQNQRS
ncbi:MAG: hypothetical protein JSS26_02185 [Nitrospira sp.]|nr:hypothetical protein [Nitrospira sp.]